MASGRVLLKASRFFHPNRGRVHVREVGVKGQPHAADPRPLTEPSRSSPVRKVTMPPRARVGADNRGMAAKYAVLLLVATLAAGCAGGAPTGTGGGSASPSSTEAPSPAASNTSVPTSSPAHKRGITITTGGSDFGTMLYDARGQAIYIWEVEESDKAECYGDCANAWPPVLTEGAPLATGDVNPSLLGTTRRTDGAVQVT